MRKGDKRLKYEDRKEIEKMKNDGVRVVVIAEKIGVHRATIYNELKRGGTPYRAEEDITTIYSTKYDTVRNDVTGNWKCIVIAENNFNVEDYALSCYKNYFDSDKTILAVENLTTKTSTSISVVSGLLYVSVYEYTKGEEHDAKAMFGGTHLVDYIVYTDNGDIEKVTDSE